VGQASWPVDLENLFRDRPGGLSPCSRVTRDLPAHPISNRRIGSRPKRVGCISIFIILTLLLIGGRLLSSWTIDYQWWKEMGQLHTWFSMLAYGVVPTAAATILGFLVFWIAHARALKHAGTGWGGIRCMPSFPHWRYFFWR